MTEFYGLPNAGEFWHWTNALHFVLVGLAGGWPSWRPCCT